MTDDWLRDALNDAVSDVEPNDALDSIRSRTKVTPMSSKRPWMYGAGGAVLATAATITAFALFTNGDGTPQSGDPGPATTVSQTPPEPTSTDPSRITNPVTVPVYYLGEVSFAAGEGGEMQTGLRLYREWWGGADGSSSAVDVAATAVRRMLVAPTDPDYSTPWSQAMDVRWVKHEDGVIKVSLIGNVQQSSVGAEGAELAVQQLIYTVQGALSVMDEPGAMDPVQILIDGQPAEDLWGHVDIIGPIERADQTGTQAAIWIMEPSDGAAVEMPLIVTGVAQVFEATVNWRVLKDGTEVDSGFETTTEGAPAFGEYSFDVTGLAPGDYVLEVYEASPVDGSATFMDTKSFQVS